MSFGINMIIIISLGWLTDSFLGGCNRLACVLATESWNSDHLAQLQPDWFVTWFVAMAAVVRLERPTPIGMHPSAWFCSLTRSQPQQGRRQIASYITEGCLPVTGPKQSVLYTVNLYSLLTKHNKTTTHTDQNKKLIMVHEFIVPEWGYSGIIANRNSTI